MIINRIRFTQKVKFLPFLRGSEILSQNIIRFKKQNKYYCLKQYLFLISALLKYSSNVNVTPLGGLCSNIDNISNVIYLIENIKKIKGINV